MLLLPCVRRTAEMCETKDLVEIPHHASGVVILHPRKERQGKDPIEDLFCHGEIAQLVPESLLIKGHQVKRNEMNACSDIQFAKGLDKFVPAEPISQYLHGIEMPRGLHLRQHSWEL